MVSSADCSHVVSSLGGEGETDPKGESCHWVVVPAWFSGLRAFPRRFFGFLTRPVVFNGGGNFRKDNGIVQPVASFLRSWRRVVRRGKP